MKSRGQKLKSLVEKPPLPATNKKESQNPRSLIYQRGHIHYFNQGIFQERTQHIRVT